MSVKPPKAEVPYHCRGDQLPFELEALISRFTATTWRQVTMPAGR